MVIRAAINKEPAIRVAALRSAVIKGTATGAAARLVIGLLAVYAVVAALGAALWWSFDSGPWTSSPVLVLTEPSHNGGVRVYGDYPDLDASDAAQRTADNLAAQGGFDRSVLMVAVPTGSGWIDSAQVHAIERWAGGDVATVAMRYSSAPSGAVYVLRPEVAERSAHALLAEITERLRAIPPEARPQLVVHGLSLGAQAGSAALADRSIADLVDATLWQGLPGAHAGSSSHVDNLGGVGRMDRCIISAINPDDPVADLSWDLLREPGRAIKVLAALPGADSAAPGIGHRYAPVLPPPGCVTPTAPDALTR